MADVLKVLMMGGQRAGKTSVLAGLVDTMTHGKVKEIVEVKEVTPDTNVSHKLAKSLESLKWHLLMSLDKTFLIDDNKSMAFDDHILEFAIPDTDSKMDIVFTDAAGEFYDMGRLHDAEIREKVKEYDVFVIAIDTPHLMEACNSDNKYCTEAINNSYNHINDMHTFLSCIDDKEGADAKLVVFVPLKCEKWIKEGKVQEVVGRVRTAYDTTIHALSKYSNIEIDIMPIQTVGNIVFQEQTKPLVCITEGKMQRRCAITNKKTQVRFEDGSVENIDLARHKFIDDPSAIIREGSSLMRPNSWFKTIGKKYVPQHCDQLAYYILQFYLAKVLFAKEVEDLQTKKNRWKWGKRIAIGGALIAGGLVGGVIAYFASKYLAKKFGTISLEQMIALTRKINDGGYLKKNTDGIVTIKESKLYELKEGKL